MKKKLDLPDITNIANVQRTDTSLSQSQGYGACLVQHQCDGITSAVLATPF